MDKKRESGIELLKITAMLLIVLYHISNTLYTKNTHFPTDYIIPVDCATVDIKRLILTWISAFGPQGNLIFMVCSAWFLVDSKKVNFRKVNYMLADVWIINIVFLAAFLISQRFDLSETDIEKCLFPTTYSLNWYITCYIFLYSIHTALNRIIYSMSQKELLMTVSAMLILYYIVNFLHSGRFFVSSFIDFIIVYFTMAYLKLFGRKFGEKIKYGGLLIGLIGTPLLILFSDYTALHDSSADDNISKWCNNNSPFLLLTAISLFFIFRGFKFTGNLVNGISSLTLLIYIIHENYLLRTFIRPMFWIYIYQNYDYSRFLIYDIAFAAVLFTAALLVSFIYRVSLQKIVHIISDKIFDFFSERYNTLNP